MEMLLKKYPTIGCCGIDCGLCPRFYTQGPSRCPGCCGEEFFNRHPGCSFISCCVRKRNIEVCAHCAEFPCNKYSGIETEIDYVATSKRNMHNLLFIKEYGVPDFWAQQRQRIEVLETMLGSYNEGRSKQFYCLAAALLSLDGLRKGLAKAQMETKRLSISEGDIKGRAKLLRSILNETAEAENEQLKMRRKKTNS